MLRSRGKKKQSMVLERCWNVFKKDLNHSKKFHRKIASIYPDYRERERELKYIVSA